MKKEEKIIAETLEKYVHFPGAKERIQAEINWGITVTDNKKMFESQEAMLKKILAMSEEKLAEE